MTSAHEIKARQGAMRDFLNQPTRVVNVGEMERAASKLGGGVLLAAGLMRGGLKGMLVAGLGGALLYRGVTGHCDLYQVLDASTADDEYGQAGSVPAQAGVHVEDAVTVNRSPEDLFQFWRDAANLPKFMTGVASVTPIEGSRDRSHWVLRGPFGMNLEWDSEIHDETPNELIAWRSLEGGGLDVAGSVHFNPDPGGRGTVVRINQTINPPGGQFGVAVAKLLGRDPESTIREDLRRFKQLMEAGEIANVEGQPSGR